MSFWNLFFFEKRSYNFFLEYNKQQQNKIKVHKPAQNMGPMRPQKKTYKPKIGGPTPTRKP